jgi:hypothetical protein
MRVLAILAFALVVQPAAAVTPPPTAPSVQSPLPLTEQQKLAQLQAAQLDQTRRVSARQLADGDLSLLGYKVFKIDPVNNVIEFDSQQLAMPSGVLTMTLQPDRRYLIDCAVENEGRDLGGNPFWVAFSPRKPPGGVYSQTGTLARGPSGHLTYRPAVVTTPTRYEIIVHGLGSFKVFYCEVSSAKIVR